MTSTRLLAAGLRSPAQRIAVAVLLLNSPARAGEAPPSPVEFDRQVRPILAEYCYTCHGPDEAQRKAKLRLDQESGVLAERSIVVPRHADESELIERIGSDDPELRMPPPKTGKRLSTAQAQSLRRWIDEGATWSKHWSFVPPLRPPVPRVSAAERVRNPIDRFVLARLAREDLQPAPAADRATLIRRAMLDLTGLPPTPDEVDAFLADSGPDAYERLVDRLLASPHHGERMALDWLDAARYADTHGYHRDAGRDMTRWRTWVIDAFNRNLPFDQFTVEQLAGDLLPGATLEQRVASGFNRNHMINIETGAVPEEYLNAYVVDRVNTTATVWLGLTVACAQCHDHKFDPISQRDYYGLYAFFNTVPENGIDGANGNAAPLLKIPSDPQRRELDRLSAEVQRAEREKQTEELKTLRPVLAALEARVPSTMVMQEMPTPRATHRLIRGEYDKHGEAITAGVPASMPPLPSSSSRNRLGLARWLVDRGNPLTARVIVNRAWQTYFGTGIVKTAEDFGTQGESPSHPELLDWLALEFMDSGWDFRHLQRLIVTSATYQQSSAIAPRAREKDPENRLLARGPRFRLPAEVIRDQALASSGLLDRRIGGSSVFPYQPAGLWEELCARLDSAGLSAQTYTPSHGAELYRRTMYTFWKRTSPPPGLASFDAPDRETCTVRRARTNTPLQAMVLLNDPTYLEAARKLAERALNRPGSDDDRLSFAFRSVLARRPTANELHELRRLLDAQHQVYRHDHTAAQALVAIGESPRDERLDVSELAAWSVVASAILNLDEAMTKG
ncbi:MAG: PSD1 and planctomycete cytochrome C domain-containing protein [Isosphaeraceae bacterium]|nr:PSD1 and planctomycete cytochrome C domain-containing protein [Isosphaeraceae bacterium]